MSQRQAFRWGAAAATFLLVAVAAGAAAETPASARINQLRYLVLDADGKGVRLFGTFDAQGPATIPYAEILAEAFRLPAEKGGVGGEPSFSLDPAPGFDAAMRRQHGFRSYAEYAAAIRTHYSRPGDYETFIELALDQAIGEIREALRRYLYYRMDARQVDERLARVTGHAGLMAMIRDLRNSGILRPSDDRAMTRLIDAAIERAETVQGKVTFLPARIADVVFKTKVEVVPRYYGIDPTTQFARILLEADLVLKAFNGAEGFRLKQRFSFHETRFEWIVRDTMKKEATTFSGELLPRSENLSIQVRPGRVALSVSEDGRVVSFERAEMEIHIVSRDRSIPTSQINTSYAAFLTKHFDEYALHFPAFWELRELAKMVAAARILRARGISLRLPQSWSWAPPERIEGGASFVHVGTGTGFHLITSVNGGVVLQVKEKTQASAMPRARALDVRAAAQDASSQADAEIKSGGRGLCFDGRRGCGHGDSLGTVRITGVPRGSAAYSEAVIDKVRGTPAGKKLLDEEAAAKLALAKATEAERKVEEAVAKAPDRAAKARLEVDLAKARIESGKAKSQFNVQQVKVEEAAKKITVELK